MGAPDPHRLFPDGLRLRPFGLRLLPTASGSDSSALGPDGADKLDYFRHIRTKIGTFVRAEEVDRRLVRSRRRIWAEP
jgi:hypothetical protein